MDILQKKMEQIVPLNEEVRRQAREKWDAIAKPLRSLGVLEDMVIDLAGITGELNPQLHKKAILIFCADNGVVEEGVTQTGQEVTAVVTRNFTKGLATINAFASVLPARVIPVDIGINADMSEVEGVVDRKIAWGTKNMAKEPAMTKEQCIKAILTGIELVGTLKKQGYQMILTGEMGIGNTSTSSAVLSVLEEIPVEAVTGKGAGLDKEGIAKKIQVIKQAIAQNQPDKDDVTDVLTKVGGFDICGMVGAYLGGAIYHIPVMIDGFISAVAANCAIRLAPDCAGYLFASHVSAEPAGQMALDAIGKQAIVHAGMCLGEGTGAVLGAQLFDYALAAYHEVADFTRASVKQYELFDTL